MEQRMQFTEPWDVVSSPDFDAEYLSPDVAPYVRLREDGNEVVGDYQVGPADRTTGRPTGGGRSGRVQL
jgi:hypothetical protein